MKSRIASNLKACKTSDCAELRGTKWLKVYANSRQAKYVKKTIYDPRNTLLHLGRNLRILMSSSSVVLIAFKTHTGTNKI